MIGMNEFVDLRLQHQIAQEIYRQQIMQRIPDPFATMLPLHLPHHVVVPPRPALTDVKAKLENDDLWQQFHQIGTEMIITKSGRRMFPSKRLSLSGLEDESSYCVLLEMVPIGDCRYKFSGSQWVPAGGAEPQSPQRMYLHPDSPATGAHWQAQPILFNKVKLTNNTLDNNGHIVLASMHKYQPRIHVVRTSDLTQIPWAPQQAFVFPETEFVAVTAYQNDRITKLKIDHNPFAKGFRETGQSRCKRKLSATLVEEDGRSSCSTTEDDRSSVSSLEASSQAKRLRSDGFIDEDASYCSSHGSLSPCVDAEVATICRQSETAPPSIMHPLPLQLAPPYLVPHPGLHSLFLDPLYSSMHLLPPAGGSQPQPHSQQSQPLPPHSTAREESFSTAQPSSAAPYSTAPRAPTKRNSFSISAILAY